MMHEQYSFTMTYVMTITTTDAMRHCTDLP